MAKSIVDKEMINSQNYDYIQFDLFGGEPFLAFDDIKPLVEYIVAKDYLKDMPKKELNRLLKAIKIILTEL